MAFEKRWAAIAPQFFTSNGGTKAAGIAGQVTIPTTIGYRVKQQVIILASGHPSLECEVKEVTSSTVMFVGPKGAIGLRSDLTLFTTAAAAQIFANEQNRPSIEAKEYQRSMFEEEPVVAQRSILVDDFGNKYNSSNPFFTNLMPASQIPFTLSALMLPTLISQYAASLTYTSVTSDNIGNSELIQFFDGSIFVGSMTLTQTPTGWVLGTGAGQEDFLLLENGNFFELENGSGDILLEA